MRRLFSALLTLPAIACGTLYPSTPTAVPVTAVPVTAIRPTVGPTDTASAPATPVADVSITDVLAFTHDDGAVSLALVQRDPAGNLVIVSIVSPPEWESIDGIYELEWSPDGRRLAMVGWVGGSSERTIFTSAVGADGAHVSEPVNLGPGQYPAWSPDSEALLAINYDHVMRTSWDVAEWEPISNVKRWYGRAIYSPDPWVLLTTSTAIGDAGASGNTSITIEAIDVQTGTRSILVQPTEGQLVGQLPNDLRLSPDGTWAAFSTYMHLSACQGYGALFRMDPDGQNLEAVQIPGASEAALTEDQGYIVHDYSFSPSSQGLAASWEIVDCAENPDAQPVKAQITLIDPHNDRPAIDGAHVSVSYSHDAQILAGALRLSMDTSLEPEIWLYDLVNGESGDVRVGSGWLARFRP